MGFVRKKNAKDYWAQKYPSQYVPFFASVMPLHKLSMFSRLPHVGETNAPIHGQRGFDPWNRVRPVIDALNAKFKVHYIPPQHVTIDQPLLARIIDNEGTLLTGTVRSNSKGLQ